MTDDTTAIDPEQPCKVLLKENADHAVRWRLSYTLKSVHRMIKAQNAVNLAAYQLQEKYGVSLSTPLTQSIAIKRHETDNSATPAPQPSPTPAAEPEKPKAPAPKEPEPDPDKPVDLAESGE